MALHQNIVHLWVDKLYGVHNDLKGQNGATMSIGRICVTRMSKKQNINTSRYTQGEIVGAYDASQ